MLALFAFEFVTMALVLATPERIEDKVAALNKDEQMGIRMQYMAQELIQCVTDIEGIH